MGEALSIFADTPVDFPATSQQGLRLSLEILPVSYMPGREDGEDIAVDEIELLVGLPIVEVGVDDVGFGVSLWVVLFNKIYDLGVELYYGGALQVILDDSQT